MSDYIKIGLKITWGVVIMFWIISGTRVKKVESQEPFLKRFMQYWFPLLVAILLLGPGDWFGHTFLRENFVPHSDRVGNIGLALCIAGAGIACWSRYQLGRNWSLSVQRKEDHELIQGGMYALVRHPIYTGLLLLFIGNTLIVGDYRGILAVVIVFTSFWYKLLKEEKLMSQTFGDRYTQYQNKTKALIPFVL